ncbi:hypothetical protein AB0D30_30965 [Streptomyces sp. NPDC048409]|uniref:NADase-type glycan-binding domain-containing protein n=1 Tax=Streptomyces sp. NPDC048409 TaxID=3154723 RepID=UPI0034133196
MGRSEDETPTVPRAFSPPLGEPRPGPAQRPSGPSDDDTLELSLPDIGPDDPTLPGPAHAHRDPHPGNTRIMPAADDESDALTQFLVAPVAPRAVTDDTYGLDDTIPAVTPQPGRSRPIRPDWRTRRQNPLRPGDQICGDCGQGNSSSRRFCARCGGNLDEAQVVPRRWWHRFRRRRGPREVALTAGGPGERPEQPGEMRRKWFGRARVAGSVVMALTAVVYASYPPFRGYVVQRTKSVQHEVASIVESQYDPVRPQKVTSATSVKGHAAENAADQFLNTYWSATFPQGAEAARKPRVLTFDFGGIVSLNQVIITAGAVDKFTAHGRPRLVLLAFGNGTTMDLTLKDTVKPQKFELHGALGVKSVKMTVSEEYPAEDNKDVAVSEVEFFSLVS